MSQRDEEIKRLINYAKGHGLKVITSPARAGDADASWSLDGTEIELFIRKRNSKTSLIMSLIHELGHHLWFINEKNRQPDLNFEAAIARIDRGLVKGKPPGKRYRKRVLNVEIAGTKWWRVIYNDVNIKIPIWKLDMNMEFDVWNYQYWYETGVDATKEQRNAKRKELTLKWKGTK